MAAHACRCRVTISTACIFLRYRRKPYLQKKNRICAIRTCHEHTNMVTCLAAAEQQDRTHCADHLKAISSQCYTDTLYKDWRARWCAPKTRRRPQDSGAERRTRMAIDAIAPAPCHSDNEHFLLSSISVVRGMNVKLHSHDPHQLCLRMDLASNLTTKAARLAAAYPACSPSRAGD